ncbi:MAG: IPT/TIG domain-containing protein [Acidobacteriota bacterium]|nr:IPT/TIG domain-containing protein [Acidobacteriota bacterium]
MNFRIQNASSLTQLQKNQLTMQFGQLQSYSEQLEDEALAVATTEIQGSVMTLQNGAHSAIHALTVIADVQKAICIATAAVGVGFAILTPTPGSIVGSINTLVQTVSQALAPAAGAVVPPPKMTSIAPTSGPAAGGTPVTITGTDLTNGASVNFGSAPASAVKWISNTSISATTPAQAAGSVDVEVVNADGQIDVLESGYKYV